MPATGPDLDQLVSTALTSWELGANVASTFAFGAAGARGTDTDRKLMARVGFDRTFSVAAGSRMDRLFNTDVGKRAVNAVGNETLTLAAVERLSMEIMAASLRVTGQCKPTDRLLVMQGEERRPPVVALMSPSIAADKTRVASQEMDLHFDILEKGLHEIGKPDSKAEAATLAEVMAGGEQALAELFLIARPQVVVTRRPKMVPLCVSVPHMRIDIGGRFSTVGILCSDADGVRGVTGAFHGIGPIGTQVLVNGMESRVKRADPVQDIVFVPLHDPMPVGIAGRGGIEKEREPSRSDPVHFDGATNQARTQILSSDAGLLRARPSVQLRLQTRPDTDQGDSGCALIDTKQDRVLGFAFERTAVDDYPGFTDWIWAANAMNALQLKPYGA